MSFVLEKILDPLNPLLKDKGDGCEVDNIILVSSINPTFVFA